MNEAVTAGVRKDFRLQIRFSHLPVAVEFTREGIIFVFLSLAIGAAAVNTGNNVLYLIFSLMLALIIVSGVISRRILSGLESTIQFPSRIFSATPDHCFVSIRNRKKRFPSMGVRFLIRQSNFARMSKYFFYIPRQGEVHAFVPFVFPARGIYWLKEFELQTKFPFSFFTKIRRFSVDNEICVYPCIFRFSDALISRISEGTVAESPYRGDSQQLLHIRDYTTLDSSRKIHWKASARMDRLVVKEFQKEQGRDLMIYYDCYNAPSGLEDTVEKAISLMASLAYHLIERSYRAQLIFADENFDLTRERLQSVLEYLARLDPRLPEGQSFQLPLPDGDSLCLYLRSRQIPPLLPSSSSSKILVIEEIIPQLLELIEIPTIRQQ